MFRVTSVADIAGQVTAKSANADHITVAAVYLPSGALKSIRKRLPANFPKWRNATDADLRYMTDLIFREAVSISVASVDKTTQDWTEFWEDAADVHAKVSSIERGPVSFLKAATMIKLIVFSYAAASALGHAVVSGAIQKGLSAKDKILVEEAVVIDNEIQGDDNRDALVSIWRSINSHQPLSNSIGLQRTAKTLQLASEQTEPLLLMADYVAGAFHSKASRANTLSMSSITPEQVTSALAKFNNSGKLTNFGAAVKLKYFDVYPEFKKFSRRSAA